MTDKRFEVRKIEPVFTDDRGSIFKLLEGFEIRDVEYCVSYKDSIRGNHYHPRHNEAILMIEGLCKMFMKDLETSDPKDLRFGIEEILVGAGNLIVCKANVVHAQVFLEDSKAVAFSDGKKEWDKYSEHTIRYQLV